METFESPADQNNYVEYDASGKISAGDLDPEAQAIIQDFKRPPY